MQWTKQQREQVKRNKAIRARNRAMKRLAELFEFEYVEMEIER